MPAEYFLLERSARNKLLKLPINIRQRIIRALEQIQKNPTSGVKLHGKLSEYYKFRVGDYRIIYHFESKKSLVLVVAIEHRQGVYR